LFENLAAKKNIVFNIEVNDDSDVFIKADEVKLKQVLINLIANAIKFTSQGKVTLKLTLQNYPDFVNGNFEVTDTGIGIKEQNIDAIFESFTQADANTTRKYGGTGLGLTIATGLLKVMGSQLNVSSQYGSGSSFSFNLQMPKSIIGNTDVGSFDSLSQKISEFKELPSLHVLLAEDNSINQLVAQKMLQKWKVNVQLAKNGQEACELVANNKFDVVLMDLDMPVMDGYEATQNIQALHKQLPIVALTAASFDNMHEILGNKGFAHVIQKPFMPASLYEVLLPYANN
jgi:CheY-like chemotaxis protein